jgi:hypothetical protein
MTAVFRTVGNLLRLAIVVTIAFASCDATTTGPHHATVMGKECFSKGCRVKLVLTDGRNYNAPSRTWGGQRWLDKGDTISVWIQTSYLFGVSQGVTVRSRP